jgi:hypothetical protein
MDERCAMRTQKIGFDQLLQVSGYEDRDTVAAWLKVEGVSFSLDEQGRPWTTMPAIERSLRRRAEEGRYPYADIAMEL